MKKIIFYAFLFNFTFVGIVFSESRRETVITYDYANNRLCSNNADYVVIYRHNLIFKIINANPFLYKITINSTPLDYFRDVPKVLADLSEKEMGQTIGPNKSDKAEKIPTSLDENRKNSDSTMRINSDINPFIFKDITSRSIAIASFYRNFRNKVQRNIPFEDLDKDIKAYCVEFIADNAEKKVNKETSWEKISPTLHTILNEAYFRLAQIKSEYDKNKIDEIKDQIKKIEDSLKINSDMVQNIDTILSMIKKENFERSITFPTVDCDELQILLKIEAIDSNIVVPYQISSPIIVQIKWGWKIDFSTGVLFQINSNDEVYILEESKNDTDKVLIKKNYDSLSFRPTANILMHVYPRSARSVKWGGLSFGLGTGDVEKISYFLGTSFILGLKNRFIINAGFAGIKIKTLAPQYKIGQEIPKNNAEKPEDLLKETFRLRVFFGITYNLSK